LHSRAPSFKEVKVKKFWIIIPATDKTSSGSGQYDKKRKRFLILEQAKTEAARRCSKYMTDYIVLESMAICRPATPPVEWEGITEKEVIE